MISEQSILRQKKMNEKIEAMKKNLAEVMAGWQRLPNLRKDMIVLTKLISIVIIK